MHEIGSARAGHKQGLGTGLLNVISSCLGHSRIAVVAG